MLLGLFAVSEIQILRRQETSFSPVLREPNKWPSYLTQWFPFVFMDLSLSLTLLMLLPQADGYHVTQHIQKDNCKSYGNCPFSFCAWFNGWPNWPDEIDPHIRLVYHKTPPWLFIWNNYLVY